jgi:hypothetical protein
MKGKEAILFLRMENVVSETGVGPLARYNPDAMAYFETLVNKLVAQGYAVSIVMSTDVLIYHDDPANDIKMFKEECAFYSFVANIVARLPNIGNNRGDLAMAVGKFMVPHRQAKFAVIWPGREDGYTQDIEPHLVQIVPGKLFGSDKLDEALITITKGRQAYRFFERARGFADQHAHEALANALAEACILVGGIGCQLPYLLVNENGEKSFADMQEDLATYNSALTLIEKARAQKADLLKKIVEIDAQIDVEIARISDMIKSTE